MKDQVKYISFRHDNKCKNVCMAECLSNSFVPLSLIHSIIVPDELAYDEICSLKEQYPDKYNGYVDLQPTWFPCV